MEMKNMFKNFYFGPAGSEYKLSHLGIAVKNAQGEMVSYDKEKQEIVNVELLNFENKKLIYLMPYAIKDIKVGDAIVHNGKPMFVVSTDKDITAIDVAEGTKKIILPTKSMFGFDFITKIVSMIDFSGTNASSDNPFGNLIPFMLMGEENMDLSTVCMLNMMSGKSDFLNMDMSNPMTMLMMTSMFNKGGSHDINPFLLMMMMPKMTLPQTTKKES